MKKTNIKEIEQVEIEAITQRIIQDMTRKSCVRSLIAIKEV